MRSIQILFLTIKTNVSYCDIIQSVWSILNTPDKLWIIGDPIVIDNGTFSWVDDVTILRNIDMRVRDGELVAVVGSVGSGKSSLLSAILGELERHSGRVNTKVMHHVLLLDAILFKLQL